MSHVAHWHRLRGGRLLTCLCGLAVILLLATRLPADDPLGLPVYCPSLPDFMLQGIDLDDPRLDASQMRRPVNPEWDELVRQNPNLQEELLASMHHSRFQLDAEGRAGDPGLPDASRRRLGELVRAFQAEMRTYQAGQAAVRRKDPLYDIKVKAAEDVAHDFVRKKSGPRGGGILPAFQCTDPRDYLRAHRGALTSAQAYILKHKFAIDWSPPPEPPEIDPWRFRSIR